MVPFSAGFQFSAKPFRVGFQFSALPLSAGSSLVRSKSLVTTLSYSVQYSAISNSAGSVESPSGKAPHCNTEVPRL